MFFAARDQDLVLISTLTAVAPVGESTIWIGASRHLVHHHFNPQDHIYQKSLNGAIIQKASANTTLGVIWEDCV
jgi:hypothetical protein